MNWLALGLTVICDDIEVVEELKFFDEEADEVVVESINAGWSENGGIWKCVHNLLFPVVLCSKVYGIRTRVDTAGRKMDQPKHVWVFRTSLCNSFCDGDVYVLSLL